MTEPMRFTPDRRTWLRGQIRLALLAMIGAMLVLKLMGNPDIWVGAVAGMGAIALRSWYLASEEMAAVWEIDGDTVTGPQERQVKLDQIEKIRILGSFVQIITKTGDKHLIKYQANPATTRDAIFQAKETA
ncbi:MAG: hypothetical protein ACI92Z_003492 [Paracoccaceae bacterium]|jgi:hypothetical protein